MDLELDVRDELRRRIANAELSLIENPALPDNVEARLHIYEEALGGRPPVAFVNIGGAWANVGAGSASIDLPPGLVTIDELPPNDQRGVLHAYVGAGVPVIHFLHISSLASSFGLPWDPSPLPAPGSGLATAKDRRLSVLVAVLYLSASAAWLVYVVVRRSFVSGQPEESTHMPLDASVDRKRNTT